MSNYFYWFSGNPVDMVVVPGGAYVRIDPDHLLADDLMGKMRLKNKFAFKLSTYH